MRRQYTCSPNAFSAICRASFFLIAIHYRHFYDRTIHFFIAATNYSPLHFIEHANHVRLISRAMKPGDEESKHVLLTGVCRTVSFPVSFCVRDAIRKFPGKGERIFFLLPNLQRSLGLTWPPILSWEKGVRGVK